MDRVDAKMCRDGAKLHQVGAKLCPDGAKLYQSGAKLCQSGTKLSGRNQAMIRRSQAVPTWI